MTNKRLPLSPAVFLDRDGVIIKEVNYLSKISQIELLVGVAKAISILNKKKVPVIVVTNQSGVARGYFSERMVIEIHDAINEMIGLEGAHIDQYYFCPHHPTEGKFSYKKSCECRKPKPGMLKKAAIEFDIDLRRSFMIGDKLSDIESGVTVGCKSILVRTGYGGQYSTEELSTIQNWTPIIVKDLESAVAVCMEEFK